MGALNSHSCNALEHCRGCTEALQTCLKFCVLSAYMQHARRTSRMPRASY